MTERRPVDPPAPEKYIPAAGARSAAHQAANGVVHGAAVVLTLVPGFLFVMLWSGPVWRPDWSAAALLAVPLALAVVGVRSCIKNWTRAFAAGLVAGVAVLAMIVIRCAI